MWCQQGSQVNVRGLSAPKSLFITGLFLISVVRCPFFSCLSVFRAQKIRTWGSPTLYLCPKWVRDPAEKTLWPGDNDHTSFPSCLSLFDYNLSKPVLNMARVRSDSILLFLFSKWYVFVWEGESAAGEKKTGRRRQEKCVCMCLQCVRASVSLSLFSLSLSLSLSLPPSCLHSILAFFPSAYLFWMDFSCLYLCPCLFVCLRLAIFPVVVYLCLYLCLCLGLSRGECLFIHAQNHILMYNIIQRWTKMQEIRRKDLWQIHPNTIHLCFLHLRKSQWNECAVTPPHRETIKDIIILAVICENTHLFCGKTRLLCGNIGLYFWLRKNDRCVCLYASQRVGVCIMCVRNFYVCVISVCEYSKIPALSTSRRLVCSYMCIYTYIYSNMCPNIRKYVCMYVYTNMYMHMSMYI